MKLKDSKKKKEENWMVATWPYRRLKHTHTHTREKKRYFPFLRQFHYNYWHTTAVCHDISASSISKPHHTLNRSLFTLREKEEEEKNREENVTNRLLQCKEHSTLIMIKWQLLQCFNVVDHCSWYFVCIWSDVGICNKPCTLYLLLLFIVFNSVSSFEYKTHSDEVYIEWKRWRSSRC